MLFNKYLSFSAFSFLIAVNIHCGGNTSSHDDTKADSVAVIDVKGDTNTVSEDANRPPIINITDSLVKKEWVIYIKDSAGTISGLNAKLSDIYKNVLPQAAAEAGLKLNSAPMAWYKSQGLPFFFEAGYTVDKKPAKALKGKVLMKSVGGDSAVVAHFYGPNEQIILGYEALADWLKSYKKTATGKPYELYVTDLFLLSDDKKNPYRTRTDIFLPHK